MANEEKTGFDPVLHDSGEMPRIQNSGKKKAIRVFLIITAVLILLVLSVVFIFRKEIRTIRSLETYEIDDLYSMEYFADYHFDEFLQVGAKDWDEYGAYVKRAVGKGVASFVDVSDFHCSSFIAENEKGEILFGRNFDYSYAPVVITETHPKTGYASIGASNMGFLGIKKDDVLTAHALNAQNALFMCSPYFTTDGMNEYGVAVSVLDCGSAVLPQDMDAPTMVTCSMIRMILENARNVDEAVELFKSYNISTYEPNHHFMIADASGRAVVMEYTDDGIIAVESDIVTNFDLYDEKHLGSGMLRYNTIGNTLEENNGVLSEEEALALLSEVVVKGRAQYSLLYNLTSGEVYVFTHGDCSSYEAFDLKMKSE